MLSDRADIVATATTSASTVVVGDTVAVTYSVTNLGPQPTGEVTATGNVFNQTIVSSSINPTQSGSTVTWQLGTLAPGQTVTFTVVYQETGIGLGAPALDVYGNVPDPDTTNNTAFHRPSRQIRSPWRSSTRTNLRAIRRTVSQRRGRRQLTLPIVPCRRRPFAIDLSTNPRLPRPLQLEHRQHAIRPWLQHTRRSSSPLTQRHAWRWWRYRQAPSKTRPSLSPTPSCFQRHRRGRSATFRDRRRHRPSAARYARRRGFVYQPNLGFIGVIPSLHHDRQRWHLRPPPFINVTLFNDPPSEPTTLVGTSKTAPFVIPFATLLANDSPRRGGTANHHHRRQLRVGGTATIAGTNVIFTPAANFNGAAQFNYVLVDSGGAVAVVDPLVSFLVRDVNDPPTGTPDVIGNIPEDSGAYVIPCSQLLANDNTGAPNETGQTLTIVGVNSASGGAAVIVGTNIVFTPFPDYNGPASFTYVVQDTVSQIHLTRALLSR